MIKYQAVLNFRISTGKFPSFFIFSLVVFWTLSNAPLLCVFLCDIIKLGETKYLFSVDGLHF